MTAAGIRVMVVDDSPTFLAVIKDILARFRSVEQVVFATNGLDAIEKVKSDPPDLVLMDLQMPGYDGIETLTRLRRDVPSLSVVLISGTSENSAELTLRALRHGAVDFVPKPTARSFDAMEEYFLVRLAPFIRSATNRVYEASRADADDGDESFRKGTPPKPPRFVLVGASTGAPTAIPALVASLPDGLAAPVLVVIDMPDVFARHLAKLLVPASRLPIVEARDGLRLTPSQIVVASNSTRLSFTGAGSPLALRCASGPSQERLLDGAFAAAATALGSGCLAVVMTGHGDDALVGLKKLHADHNHYCLVQSPGTCTAAGLPEAVIGAGLADEVVPLAMLGPRIGELVG